MRMRLAVRMGVALCLGAAAILGLAGAWNLHLQRAHLTALVRLSADQFAETIRASTRDAMLRNDADGLHRTLQNIGSQPGVARVRVFNKEGRIRTSTDVAEVGRLVNMDAEQCIACHQGGQPLVRIEGRDRVRTFTDATGQRILAVIAPIHNETACMACHNHPASQQVLGVLDVQLSTRQVDEAIWTSEVQMVEGLSITVAAVLLLAAFLLWVLVLRPLRRMAEAVERVAAGDLGTRMRVTSRDEMGELAGSWNRMTEELERSRHELQAWNQVLEERVEEKTQELRRTHERMMVVEKMASLGKLAATVAHEINNPLAGIRTFARMLRRQVAPETPAATEERGRALEMIDHEAGRCGDIVRDLLLFSRSAPPNFAEADVQPVLERCLRILDHPAEIKGVDLELERAAGPVTAYCDASQVEQLVMALTLNALDATPAGGRVHLSARLDGADMVCIRVGDTGSGIAPEDRARIFEPFFTTKEMGKGIGLGLAVCYGIVERHRGRIEVESTPGAGTIFTVSLPRRPEPEEAP